MCTMLGVVYRCPRTPGAKVHSTSALPNDILVFLLGHGKRELLHDQAWLQAAEGYLLQGTKSVEHVSAHESACRDTIILAVCS